MELRAVVWGATAVCILLRAGHTILVLNLMQWPRGFLADRWKQPIDFPTQSVSACLTRILSLSRVGGLPAHAGNPYETKTDTPGHDSCWRVY